MGPFAGIHSLSSHTSHFPSQNSERAEIGHQCVSHVDNVRPAISSHRERQGPGRRKPRPSRWSAGQRFTAWPASLQICSDISASFLALLFVFAFLMSGVAAEERLHPALQKLARRGELLFDRSPRPELPSRVLLMERDAKTSGSSDVPSATFTLVTATGNGVGGGAAAAATASVATTSPKSTSLPQPFDTTIGSNFTTVSGCPKFFNFLSEPQFQQCYPFSLLLQTSHQFFEAQKSYVRTTISLDAGCNANFAKCNSLMNSLAYKLTLKENCGADYAAQNPIVLQAYTGLITYQPMYQAGCLKDSKGSYCFASAITMTNSSLSDAYPYYLPLGTDMPVGVRPTCSSCLKNTMNIFQAAASNTTQPVSRTYLTAAQQINMACGPDYVRETIEYKSSAGLSVGSRAMFSSLVSMLIMAVALFQ